MNVSRLLCVLIMLGFFRYIEAAGPPSILPPVIRQSEEGIKEMWREAWSGTLFSSLPSPHAHLQQAWERFLSLSGEPMIEAFYRYNQRMYGRTRFVALAQLTNRKTYHFDPKVWQAKQELAVALIEAFAEYQAEVKTAQASTSRETLELLVDRGDGRSKVNLRPNVPVAERKQWGKELDLGRNKGAKAF
ncbi:conserved hypothetical Ustilaginaceae-specific protein [Sporisorium reilianum SRZ2]|uniref:Conserved hypothetical Ustilaginaceae-specific protein n=1 Tax=Sporisorium reilianum (strain SRZ2) TaxID=999809 RepID=E7A097_SPORE|nr:conserved hypothetical Ustilaginaceae-specific protein [Sporisorium reilianum SRZ2]